MSTRTGAKSITHEHMLAVVMTERKARGEAGPLRVLDVGCGDGALLGYLAGRIVQADWRPSLETQTPRPHVECSPLVL